MLVVRFILILFLIPFFTHASVVINEIAWMGTINSTADEWIELYNNGNNSVDLNGWTLTILDKKDISLSGNILANSYYLIERTDDNTVSNVTADLISSFGTGLSNGGAVLILKDNQGMEMQKLDLSSGWLAGDNSTKQTMQWNGSSWFTAISTPRSENIADQFQQEELIQAQSSQQEITQSSSVDWPVEPRIFANAGIDKNAVAGADVVFTGESLGLNKESLANARYVWSFGDGGMAEGKNVKHVYKYPSEYIAVLNVSSGEYSASDTALVKVIPNQLIISEANKDFIKLQNNSNLTLDISNWFLRSGQIFFKFPETTLIKAKSSLPVAYEISKIVISNADQAVDILYSNGSVAFSFPKDAAQVELIKNEPVKINQPESEIKVSALETESENKNFDNKTKNEAEETQVANVADSVKIDESSNLGKWLMVVLGIGAISGAGFIFIKNGSKQ